MKKQFKSICFGLALCACAFTSVADEEIPIYKPGIYLIPISISGFNGEVASVVRFDLEVLGMETTTPDKAEFLISGSNNGKLEGRLADANKNVLINKIYQGGSPRAMAHAFAQEVLGKIRPGLKPIFNGRIAFRVQNGPNYEIGVSDFDGHNGAIATHDNSLVNGPTWFPNGRTLLYASWRNGPTQILEHDITTGQRSVWAKYPGANYSPSVSPDGRRVAMVLNKRGTPDLYVCNVDGTNLKQLTFTPDDESSPCWSPDSRTICFVARAGRAGLYKVNADGGPVQKLRIGGAYGHITEPDWSPDGKTIVFTSNTGGFTLYAVPADGGNAEKLVQGEDASWAPNSRTVIFTRRENDRRVLSLLDVPTKHFKNVPEKFSGSSSQPSWAR